MARRSKRNPVTIRGPWFAMPLELLRSAAFASLSPHATKLFLDLCSQFGPNGLRNGDITATPSIMKARGWTGCGTLQSALNEILDAGLLFMTRQGNKRRCSLYALTPWPMDCDLTKLDVKPGAYGCADWTHGNAERMELPTNERPAIWNRPRKNASRTPATGQQTAVMHPPRVESESSTP